MRIKPDVVFKQASHFLQLAQSHGPMAQGIRYSVKPSDDYRARTFVMVSRIRQEPIERGHVELQEWFHIFTSCPIDGARLTHAPHCLTVNRNRFAEWCNPLCCAEP